ncbi:MAG: carbohydrate ABC transporter permease [Chloroflexota bacterium]
MQIAATKQQTLPQRQPKTTGLRLGKRGSKLVGDIIAWTLLLLGSIIMVLPFFWMVSSSFKTFGELFLFPPQFIPEQLQWQNYLEIWRRLPFHLFFRNSFFISTTQTIGVLFTSSLAGYAFSRLRFPGRDQIFLIYLSTMMIPFAVRMIPLFILMRAFGWVDTHYALIVPGIFSAWGTFLMRQFMMTIPRELEDAALIDGATFFQIYWRIILPLTGPALATLGIFEFMGSWNDFLWPLIILNSMDMKTISLGLAAFRAMSAMKTPWHLVMTASVVSVLPIIVLFLAGQKYYVRGIVTTGLKG